MNGFIRLAYLSTIWTYLLIFLGGLVRVSGAGLGCPDWPRCFGRWIPPTSISQLPANMDPSLFNFTLAWIEYVNRLAGVILGFLILATAIYAIVKYRKVLTIVIPAVLAALLTAYQGWQGGQVVASELKPLLVSAHLGIALIIVSLLVYMTINAFRYENRGFEPAEEASKMRYWVLGLWFLAMIQVIFGADIRGSLEVLSEQYPLAKPLELLSRVGVITDLHYFIGAILLVVVFFLGPRILKLNKTESPLIKQSAHGIVHLAITQIIIGVALVFTGIPQLLQLFHLWFAALFIGIVIMLYAALTSRKGVAS